MEAEGTDNKEYYKGAFESISKETETFVSDFVDIIERLRKENESLHQRVKELECVGFKMLSSIGNYMNDSRSGATYVFDYHSPSLDSGDLCSQPAWIDSETGDVLDPSEAFEIYRFEAQELLTKYKE